MSLKRLFKFAVDNYFISIFLACILFVALVSIFKLFFTKPTYVYVKVKMGQGLWWASTAKPSFWFIQSLKKAQKDEKEKSLTGQPIAEILSFRYYPWWGSNQYDVYLILKLKVSGSKKTGKYNFKRAAIGVGSPIDLEFPSVQFSGTIIEISEKPIKDNFEEKTIYLTKKAAFPWEFDSLKINDSYYDGQEKVFQIIDKTTSQTRSLSEDIFGNYPGETELRRYIIVKAKIKVKKKDNQLIFAEEQIIAPGKTLNLSTENFQFHDYVIAKVE